MRALRFIVPAILFAATAPFLAARQGATPSTAGDVAIQAGRLIDGVSATPRGATRPSSSRAIGSPASLTGGRRRLARASST